MKKLGLLLCLLSLCARAGDPNPPVRATPQAKLLLLKATTADMRTFLGVNAGTNVNATNITTGTLADARLSTNISTIDGPSVYVRDYLPNKIATADWTIDTAAAQAAIDTTTNWPNAYGGKAHVIFPAGNFSISNLVWRVHGVVYEGAGKGRTILTAATQTNDVFSCAPWAGWNMGGTASMWYATLRNLSIKKTITDKSISTSAAINLVRPDPLYQLASRVKLENVEISGFYFGVLVNNAVGFTADRCELYGNNFPLYLEKCDNAKVLDCYLGDANLSGVNRFGADWSAGITYTNGGFSLQVIGGEGRRAHALLDASCGQVSVQGFNYELADGPFVLLQSGTDGGTFYGLRVSEYPAWNTNNPVFRCASGIGQKCFIGPGAFTASSYPKIELAGSGDYANVAGCSLTVTNTADGTSWTAPAMPGSLIRDATISTNKMDATAYVAFAGGGTSTAGGAGEFYSLSVTSAVAGHWGLNETGSTQPDSVELNDFVPVGGTLYSVTGKVGNGVTNQLGPTAWLTAGTATNLVTTSPFTVCAWFVRCTAGPSACDVLQRTNDFRLYYCGTAVNRMRWSAGTNAYIQDTTSLNAATWYMVTAWWDGSQQCIRVNLGTVNSNAATATPASGAALTALQSQEAFGGLAADNIYFYNRVLTSQEVTNLYAAGSGLAYSTSPTTLRARVSATSRATVGRLVLGNGTNQVTFAGTNSAPANTNAVKWLSVQVAGETNAYRLPLCE
jgi:hypothetical protein